MTKIFNACVIIPIYNHQQALEGTVIELQKFNLPIFLIDDGSDSECLAAEKNLQQKYPQIYLNKRTNNGGKGAAVKDGLRLAYKLGFTHALQIDADGQHNTGDVPVFINAAQASPQTLIAGRPEYDDSVPKHRLYARYLTHIWVWINTLSFDIKDSMCGFRIYPLKQTIDILNQEFCGNRMDFDTEIIVRWHWRQHAIKQFYTKVNYPPDGISHFLPGLDNWLITKMHIRLFFGMLWHLPKHTFIRLFKLLPKHER